MDAPPKDAAAAPDRDELSTVGPEGLTRLLMRQQRDQLIRLLEGQSRVLEMIAEGVGLHTVLDELMHVIEQQVDGLLSSVLLLSDDGKHVLHGGAPSLPDEYNQLVNGLRIGPRAGSCGTAAYTGRPVIVTDIASDPLWADYREVAAKFGLRACWSTPILSKRGEVLGTFAMYYRQPMSPTPMHRDLIALATHLARVAIERDSMVTRLTRLIKERDESLSILAIGSHELRSPLTVLRLEAETLLTMLREAEPNREAERLAVKWLAHLERLGRLVGDLLDVSRLAVGQLALQLEDGDLAELVREASERVRKEFQHRGCALTVRADTAVPGKWDRMRVEQVVTNLLINALKYGNGQPVTVLVDGDEQRGRVSVQDSGIGIAPDQKESIFERFGRAVAERSYEGVGLGLWITRQIVEALGGSIRVDSELGKGSTFIVELPRARLQS
jgi:two-component system cell cycle sensor histidine kinase PleC